MPNGLGLDMETVQPAGLKSVLAIAARSISTSYRDIMTAEMLATMLRSGVAPPQFQPHLMDLLDETPLPVVVKAVAEAATSDVPAKKIMKHLGLWAQEWKCAERSGDGGRAGHSAGLGDELEALIVVVLATKSAPGLSTCSVKYFFHSRSVRGSGSSIAPT
jgi:hypothetical protein